MKKLALIADIHGNDLALKAVLEDIERHAVDGIYCLGDLVGYAPFPNEVVDIIRQNNIQTVLGNYDDAIGFGRLVCGCDFPSEEARIVGEQSLAWTREHTTEESQAYLQVLPREIWLDIEGLKTQLVHGSPRALNEYIMDDSTPEFLREIFDMTQADILVVGHTHKPFYRLFGGHHIINAGSVGRPKHGDPNAAYCILTVDDGVEVEIQKVPYDAEAMAKSIVAAGLPGDFAEVVRTGRSE
jgi:putative phosphoesterase